MDPLSLITGVAGLISLAASVGSNIWKLRDSFIGTNKSLSRLADEVAAIGSILTNIQYRLDAMRQATKSSSGTLEVVLEVPLQRCRETLRDIQKELVGEVTFRRKLSWALKDEEKVSTYIERLARDKTHFTLVLQLDITSRFDNMQATIGNIHYETTMMRDNIKDGMTNMIEEQEMKKKEEKEASKKRLLGWLGPLDFNSKLEDNLTQRQPNTCLWLFESQKVKDWKSKPGGVLWLYGIPGSGKTILASTLIDMLLSSQSNDESLAYAFCDFRQPESRDTVKILQSILAEMIENFEGDFSEKFEELVSLKKKGKRAPATMPKLVELINKASLLWEKPRIVIDALDEVNDRECMLKAIQLLAEGSQLSLFLTSRKEVDLYDALRDFPSISLHDEQLENIQADINHHIHEEVINRPKLRNLPLTLKKNLYLRLSGRADGMFRWVQCQLDFIATRKTFKGVQDALNDLPSGLFSTYERILMRMEQMGEETTVIAKRSLRLVLGAYRPLRLSQIAEAIMIEPRQPHLNEDLTLLSPDIILEVCTSLLLHNPSTDIVTISHFTVQEYLLSAHLQDTPLADYYYISLEKVYSDLSILVLTYMSLKEFDKGPCSSAKELQSLREHHPFLPYVAEYWYEHVKRNQEDDDVLFETITENLVDGSDSQCHRLIQQSRKYFSDNEFSNSSSLYSKPIAIFFIHGGPMWIIQRLLVERPRLANEIFSPDTGNALSLASQHFQRDLVKILLQHGASADQPIMLDGRTRNALLTAITHGNDDSTRDLIKGGANIHITLPGGWTPLHEASASGSLPFVEMIVEAGCEMNPKTDSGKTPLSIAFEMQQPTIARYLINHGASLDSLTHLIGSQVDWAISEPWYPDLQRILQSGGRQLLNLSQGQVLEASQLLADNFGLPFRPLSMILDMAEYWMVNHAEREELKMYDQSDMGKGNDYLSITIKGSAVRRMVFRIVSHDQGFSSHPRERGTYWNSWTWFEAGHSGSQHRKRIQTNIHAQWESHLHTIVWDYRDPECKEWLSELKEGHTVTVWARALYPAWVNYVEKVQIMVYSSV